MHARFLYFIVSVFAASCTSGVATHVETASESIINGAAEPGSSSVYYLAIRSPSPCRGDLGSLCTATLISHRVVLTAKHCIKGATVNDLQVCKGDDARTGTLVERVKEIRTTPGEPSTDYAQVAGIDVALLILETAADDEPMRWASQYSVLKNEPVTIEGYGYSDPYNSATRGQKYVGQSEIIEETKQEFTISGQSKTCAGDSGGPAILADGVIAGVVSYGTTNCSGASTYTRLDAHANLINQAIVDSGGQAQPASRDGTPWGGPSTVDLQQGNSTHADGRTALGCAALPSQPSTGHWLTFLSIGFFLTLRRRRTHVFRG